MKHPTRDPSPAEQERFFLETWERENAGMNGRHDPNAPQTAEDRSRRPRPLKAASASSQLLESARGFPGPFLLSDLVVAAWMLHPEMFGLKGREEDYPSDKRVGCLVDGKRGLVSRGLLVRLPGGKLRVASPPE